MKGEFKPKEGFMTEKKENNVLGIIMAGGKGTRLYPATKIMSKQLLPVYDKPMIYYPLSVLMTAGIREIAVISDPFNLPIYKTLLGNGSHLGIKLYYIEQHAPKGIAQAFSLCKHLIKKDSKICLILGDNIFYGTDVSIKLKSAIQSVTLQSGAHIFGYQVGNAKRYGVMEFDDEDKLIGIQEKPEKPASNYAVVGLYIYDSYVLNISKELKPSNRDELEITDVNNYYLKNGNLRYSLFKEGVAWLDTGTHQALLQASNFIATIESRQGIKIGCIEEIAYKSGYIDEEKYKFLLLSYKL